MPNEAPPVPEVTLLELLEQAAKRIDCGAGSSPDDCDMKPPCQVIGRRLRAAATRLNEALHTARRHLGEGSEAAAVVYDVLSAINGPAPVSNPVVPRDESRVYPCDDCGKMRTKAEGGTVFTVCDACWDKHHGPPTPVPGERDEKDAGTLPSLHLPAEQKETP